VSLSSPLLPAKCIHRRCGEGGNLLEALEQGDALLQSAYASSMRCAQDRNIELLGFSLLSAGVFRGRRSLEQVLRIAVSTIGVSAYEGLREVHLIAFTEEELATLIEITEGVHCPAPAPLLIGPGSADSIRQFLSGLESSLS
jgi:CTP-dependent riboflavin kinase